MTYKSIKLLALAVICGCSLIGFALTPFSDGRILILFVVFLMSGSWFLVYWFQCEEHRR